MFERIGQVAVRELVLGTHIQDRRRSPAQPVKQFIARYRFELVPRPEIARHNPRNLGAVAFADPAEREQLRPTARPR
jgi:hypothetical protein